MVSIIDHRASKNGKNYKINPILIIILKPQIKPLKPILSLEKDEKTNQFVLLKPTQFLSFKAPRRRDRERRIGQRSRVGIHPEIGQRGRTDGIDRSPGSQVGGSLDGVVRAGIAVDPKSQLAIGD